jgi:hypothetical protein
MTDSRVPAEIEIDLSVEDKGHYQFNHIEDFQHMIKILKHQNMLGKNIVGTILITNEEHNTLYKEKSFDKK